ncbi:putative integral membrane protein [Babesia bovis T2Bo]|uniref:Uncharacterized protein n=1 Tax=Babesia bovis TaxID=5865 RepID=A7AUG8_BABBO|nr:putative integral membrane protein [Babesia bovis T2Bo]EDO06579.1 putative integral membrane protein [Babesia bovis T2Bo]|eukprot:XP_001610147.1 hypothetical protein [Babesia bovis T2Bo]
MDVCIKGRRCNLGRLVEAMLVGSTLLIGLDQFELLAISRPHEVGLLYTYYLGTVIMTLCLALSKGAYIRQCVIESLFCHVFATVVLYGSMYLPDGYLVVRILVTMATANLGTVLGLQLLATYSSNVTLFLALLASFYLGFRLPNMCRALDISTLGMYGMFLKETPAQPLLYAKIIACVTVVAIRYNAGFIKGKLLDNLWLNYRVYLKVNTLSNPFRRLYRDIRKNTLMWSCLANLAGLTLLLVTLPPHMILHQSPLSTSWISWLETYELWSQFIGLGVGIFLPLPIRNLTWITVILFATFLLYIIHVLVFAYFNRYLWITMDYVTPSCVILSFIAGYTLSFVARRMAAMFFVRTCLKHGDSGTKPCCNSLNQGKCFCIEQVGYHKCEPRGGAGNQSLNPPGTNHVIWLTRDESSCVTKCVPLRCRCDKANPTPDCNTCKNHEKTKLKCKTQEKEATKHKDCCCNIDKLLSGKRPPRECDKPNCITGGITVIQTSTPRIEPKPPMSNVYQCRCNPNGEGALTALCERCTKYTAKDRRCYEWIASTQSQHYMLKDAHASTCSDCDLTLILRATPIGYRGNVNCLPMPSEIKLSRGWASWNTDTDRVYLGYIDSKCPACSLVEVRPRCFIKENIMTMNSTYPNHFTIEDTYMGSCCHDGLMLKIVCRKRDMYPNLHCRLYPNKRYTVKYVYFTSAAVMKEELAELEKEKGGSAPTEAASKAADGKSSTSEKQTGSPREKGNKGDKSPKDKGQSSPDKKKKKKKEKEDKSKKPKDKLADQSQGKDTPTAPSPAKVAQATPSPRAKDAASAKATPTAPSSKGKGTTPATGTQAAPSLPTKATPTTPSPAKGKPTTSQPRNAVLSLLRQALGTPAYPSPRSRNRLMELYDELNPEKDNPLKFSGLSSLASRFSQRFPRRYLVDNKLPPTQDDDPTQTSDKQPPVKLNPLDLEDFNRCCFSIATRVFAYYHEVDGDKNPRICVDQEIKCQCGSDCRPGCCIRVNVTSEAQEKANIDRKRFVVAANFGLIYMIILALCALVEVVYRRPGLTAGYNLRMDLETLKKEVTYMGWERPINLWLYTATPESVLEMDPSINKRTEKARDMLGTILPYKLQKFEHWAQETAATEFAHYNEPGDHRLDAVKVAMLESAVIQTLRYKAKGIKQYLSKWEQRWNKELSHYHRTFIGNMKKQAFKSRAAQIAMFDPFITATEASKLHQYRVDSWNELTEEVRMSQLIRRQETEINDIDMENKDILQNVRQMLQKVWKKRMQHLLRWKAANRWLYEWSGFIKGFYELEDMWSYHDSIDWLHYESQIRGV